MPRVVHFEIHAKDPARATQFYQKVFDWKFQKWEGPMAYWMITTGPEDEPGINGGLVERRGTIDGQAVIAYVCTMEVPDLETFITSIESQGGKIVVPKMPIPGVGWLAYAQDTEENIFGIMQNDPEAK
ncbi:MAG: VOC family protein [Calditrichia bacterium]